MSDATVCWKCKTLVREEDTVCFPGVGTQCYPRCAPAGPNYQEQLQSVMADIAKLGVELGCSSTATPEAVFQAARDWAWRALTAERQVAALNEIIEAGRAAHNEERVALDWLAREKARLEDALREALEAKE